MKIPKNTARTQKSNSTKAHNFILHHATDTSGGGAYTKNTSIVTNSEVSFSASEVNSSPPPFLVGQRVVVLSLRKSREKYHGRVGIVAATVKHRNDSEWTVYLTFPPRNQAVAFLASELALGAEDCLLVGGAA